MNFWFMAVDSCGCCFMLSWLSISVVSYNSYLYAPILSLFLSVLTCMNVKTSKVLICFFFAENFDMNTKSWIVISHITILQQNFKTQVATSNRALIYLKLYGSVAEWISHTAFNIPCLLWKEFETREEQILYKASQL